MHADHVIPYGKLKGKTIAQVEAAKGGDYLKWLSGRMRKAHPESAAAIDAYLDPTDAAPNGKPKLVVPDVDHDAPRTPSDMPDSMRARARAAVEREARERGADAPVLTKGAPRPPNQIGDPQAARSTSKRHQKAPHQPPAPPAPRQAAHTSRSAPKRQDDGLLVVVKPYALVWPDGSARGGPGTVILANDPFRDFVPDGVGSVWSQRYKCRPAPAGAKPTPITSRKWAARLAAAGCTGYVAQVSPGVTVPIAPGVQDAQPEPARGRTAQRRGRSDRMRDEREPPRTRLPGDTEVPDRVTLPDVGDEED